MYKLIALDCDGTLLNDKKEIDQETIDILRKVKDKDIKIVLATSRPFYKLRRYLKELDLVDKEQYTIAFNGGYILNNTEDIILHKVSLDNDIVSKIINFGKQFNLYTYAYINNRILASDYYEDYVKSNLDTIVEVSDLDNIKEPVYKIIIHGPDKEEVKRARNLLDDSFSSLCEITSSNENNIEFIPFGNSKPHALELLGKKLNIDRSEMIAFGDNENDLEMFNFVGYRIAMSNGIDELKSIANRITLSNNENGIASALKSMMDEGII